MILSVTELCEAVTVQIGASPALRLVTVRGEVSEPRSSGGHTYFTIRDAQSAFRCIRWASVPGEPVVAGRAFDVTGRIDLWAARGELRLIVSRVREVDAGERHRALAQLTERLRLEGLFDPVRKRGLPSWPSRIGVATSADGAVIHDLVSVIGRRMPLSEVVLAPCAVQGVTAASSIVAAIAALARSRVDLIVVARGGGSADDLAAFNEEAVARAVRRASEGDGIPVVSAVGHETDVTLCDHAADVRAPTPSVAGEIVAPDAASVRASLLARDARASRAVRRLLGAREATVAATGRRVEVAARAIELRVEARLDRADRRVAAAVSGRIASGLARTGAFVDRARAAASDRLVNASARLVTADAALRLLSPMRVLDRGYAIVEDERGRIVPEAAMLDAGQAVNVRLRDGSASATITRVTRGLGARQPDGVPSGVTGHAPPR